MLAFLAYVSLYEPELFEFVYEIVVDLELLDHFLYLHWIARRRARFVWYPWKVSLGKLFLDYLEGHEVIPLEYENLS